MYTYNVMEHSMYIQYVLYIHYVCHVVQCMNVWANQGISCSLMNLERHPMPRSKVHVQLTTLYTLVGVHAVA